MLKQIVVLMPKRRSASRNMTDNMTDIELINNADGQKRKRSPHEKILIDFASAHKHITKPHNKSRPKLAKSLLSYHDF